MILSSAGLAFVLLSSSGDSGQAGDPIIAARRLAATAELAAQEYRIGVVGGRVVAAAEVEEARLFLGEARRSAADLPPAERDSAVSELERLVALVAATGSPDSLDAGVRQLTAKLAARLGVSLDDAPAVTPSLARGRAVYAERCASCHGDRGRGDGPGAAGLDPPPADLANAAALRDATPVDFYRRVTIGVVGTAMPAFERGLSADDRWAVAAYATLLRLPRPAGEVPPSLRAFSATAGMSDPEVATALAATGDSSAARVAAVRSAPAGAADAGVVFARVRAQADSAGGLALAGRAGAAGGVAMDAYMTFEQVERSLRARQPSLAAEVEASFAELRAAAASAAPGRVTAAQTRLAADLERAERALGETASPITLFAQSFVILAREGLEAILVVGALMTFLAKTGAGHRKRDIHLGVAAAIALSLLTALAIETVFRLSRANQDALEGATMLAATAMLFYVSYWLLSKMEVAKWNRFVRSKVQDALTSGSVLALASVAFLAVYREGFETVLFYKALFVSSGTGASALAIVAGMVAGGLLMAALYIAVNRFGVRLPLKPLFAVTSAFLYYMAFVFAGKGVAELQEGGFLPTTIIAGAPRVPAIGLYPTAETLLLQGMLLALLLAAIVWTFLLEPRRLGVRSVLVPEATVRATAAASADSGRTPERSSGSGRPAARS
ncbi:MAG TPA: FTR1 family protein [Gemmatimonadales bacterium]|nr:FTR1 family protein [Gemmatimonadales bacterium]